MGNRAPAIESHVNSCESCRKELYRVKVLLSPPGQSIRPSAKVEKRILKTYRDCYPRKAEIFQWRNLSTSGKHLLYAAASVFIVFSLFLFILYQREDMKNIPLSISYIKGKVFVNNTRATLTTRIKLNSQLRVEKNSIVELTHNNTFSIKIIGDSILKIEKGTAKGDKNQQVYSINILKGQVLSKFNYRSPHFKYVYTTPTAHLKPRETEFLLKITDNETVVIMRSGTTKIKSLNTKEEILSSPNKKYTITTGIDSEDVNDDDINDFDNYESTRLHSPREDVFYLNAMIPGGAADVKREYPFR